MYSASVSEMESAPVIKRRHAMRWIAFTGILLCLVASSLALPALSPGTVAQSVDETQRASQDLSGARVLVLHSYHQGFSWTDNISKGIQLAFAEHASTVEVIFEFMDTRRVYTDEYFRQLLELYRLKYAETKIDVIIASDDQAFGFAMGPGQEVFPDVPIVFCSVSGYEPSMRQGRHITGLQEAIDIAATLELALRLHPNAKEFAVVTDMTRTGQALKAKAEAVFQGYEDRVQFRYLEHETVDELLPQVSALSEDTIVFLFIFSRDKTGRVFSHEHRLRTLTEHCPVPIYSVWEFYIGHGIVGGMLTSGKEEGRIAGTMALRILRGENASDIPLEKSPTRYMFDYVELERFGIKESQLPEGSIVVNKPFSFYGEYKLLTWSVALFIALLLIIIALLIRSILMRKRAEEALRESHERFLTVLDGIDAHIYAADMETYQILFMNQQMQDDFGGNLVGKICWEVFRGESGPCAHCTNDELLDADGNPAGVCIWEGHNPITETWYINYDRAIEWIDGRLVRLQVATDISKRKRAEEEIRQRTAQLEALREIGLELTAQLDLGDLLRSIVSRATELLGGTGGGLYLYRPDQDVLEWAVSIGSTVAPIGTILHRGEGLSGKVLERGEPIKVDDYWRWEGRSDAWADYPFEAILGVPVRWGKELLGVLDVNSDVPGAFSPADVELLSLFATQAAIAIRNARLYEETRQRALEQETLREAVLALTTTLDRNEVIDRILAQLQEVVPYDTGSVQLLRAGPEQGRGASPEQDQRGHYLEIVGARGFPNPEEILGLTFDPNQEGNPNREVVRTRTSFIVADAPTVYEDFSREPHAPAGIRSWLGTPMLVGERLIGMLALDKSEPGFYTEEHTRLTEAFAAQAAIAVENSRLFQAEREQRELTQALAEAAAVVSSTLDLDHVLDCILEQVARVVAGDAFNVMLVEEDSTARVVRWRGYERLGAEDQISRFIAPIADYPNLVRLTQSGAPVVIPDVTVDPDWVEVEGWEWLRSYVGAPVRVGNVAVGFLNVHGTQPGQFGPADGRRLEGFANHAATAIENAQLYQQLHEHAAQLEQRVEERTAEVQAQYARLDAILRSTTDGILVTDADGGMIQANPVAQTWLTKTLSPEEATRLRETAQRLAIRAEEHPTELLELTGMDLELKASPILKPKVEEEEESAVVVVHDVSELKALERMKTRFVSNISHELRTPITTIRLYVHLMEKQPTKWQEYLGILRQEADHQARLVEDILQISRIDAGRLEMAPCPTPLNELTEAAVARYMTLAQEHGLMLEHIPAHPGPVVLVDSKRMTQVLSNLVGNAIRYTFDDGAVVVSTSEQRAKGRTWATVTVADTGMGIPENELSHVFDRFFRGEEPRAMQLPGTGLGLSIVKEIVELHGGHVTVESEKGVGSTFTVWLPLAG